MRYLPEVLHQVLQEIPDTEELFIAELLDIQDSASYSAPEGMGLWWREANEVINEHIEFTEDPTGWQKAVVDIWMDRSAK